MNSGDKTRRKSAGGEEASSLQAPRSDRATSNGGSGGPNGSTAPPKSAHLPRFQGPVGVALATALLLVPFLDKPFHIDDTVFLRIARQIEVHPLEPYNFQYNWFYSPATMWRVTLHPPLHSYILAAVGMVAGYGEIAMHLLITAIAVGCALLMYALSQRFCRWPALATMLTVVSPAFLVSAGTLMADVPLLFFWLLTTYLAVRSAESDRGAWLWLAGLAASAAAMTKYFGIAVVPVIAVYWVIRQRRFSAHLAALALPVIVLVLWGWYSKEQANVFHPLGAAGYAVKNKTVSALLINVGVMFSFLGGTLLWPVFLFPSGARLPGWLSIPSIVLTALASCVAFRYLYPENALLFTVFAVGGVFVLSSAIASCHARSDADTVLLGLWFFGTMTFTAFINWTVNARVVLPAVLPAALLALRWLETLEARDFWQRWLKVIIWPVVAISMLVALSDAQLAEAGRDFAQTVVRELIHSGKRVYFAGHWGFQHYMEQEGALPLNVLAVSYGESPLRPNDLLVVPAASYNTNVIFNYHSYIPCVQLFEKVYRNPYKLLTMSGNDEAGFYSREWGVLPFNLGWNRSTRRVEGPVISQFVVLQIVPFPPMEEGQKPGAKTTPPASDATRPSAPGNPPGRQTGPGR